MRRLAVLAASVGLAACATTPGMSARESRAYADFLIGHVANARADHAAAADRYFAAMARNPGDQNLVEGALLSSLASGDVERSRRAARLAAREDAPAYAYMVRAADALVGQRYAQADAELDRTQGTAAEQLLARMMTNWASAGQGRSGDIAADLAPLASVRPYGGLFAYQQAMVLDYSGQQVEALAAYEAAAQGGLWLPSGVARHADLLARTGARDQALVLLRAEANASNPELAAMRARIEAGQPTGLAPLTPARGAAAAVYGMSAIFRQEHDPTNSLAALTLSLILDPGSDGARLSLAQQQSEIGQVGVAQRVLSEVSANSPYSSSARTLEAWMLFDNGDKDGAIAVATSVAQTGDLRARRALADMYRSAGRFAESEALYDELIAAQPNDWRPYFSRGAARERLGRWPEAEADFQRALELSPDQPDVLNYLGYSWVDRGERLQEGLRMIRRAAEIRPMSGAIIDSLGWAYFRLGDYAQAVDWLEAAVRLEPADPTLTDHLGDAYWRVGRRIEARFQWQRAMTLDPADPEAIRLKIENGLPAIAPTQAVTR
ncbi:MAG: tetratricopeptide repeat protein [Hyphomonadaceae bacterium]|nr:tetratricopeptide repeat protein [Hyphomonadaceae bacterium]